ncbi:MAG: SDR family NAD(P)-dependent oxidoreductase, partial [Solirubrobacteraceae bacterium]
QSRARSAWRTSKHPHETLTIVIVGATSGIGRATATKLANQGHRVLGIGRNPDRARTLDTALAGNVARLGHSMSRPAPAGMPPRTG